MKRRIISIDKEKCNGCGLCVSACHEGAIGLKNGKAELLREDYCDGLGDCLPACPAGAITFIEREAKQYNEAAVLKNKLRLHTACPGTQAKAIKKEAVSTDVTVPSRLSQWPCQIKLVPTSAPYLENADLLIAADCTAFSYGNFHNDMIKNRITLIGCPKLDAGDYSLKLTEILEKNEINSITVARMQVPCCSGIENAVRTAIKNSGKRIPFQVIIITTDGKMLEKCT